MKASTKRQIRNGLRSGGSLGLFFIAAMLFGIALDGMDAQTSGHFRLWPDGIITTGLIVLAAAITLLTAREWILYIGGCLLFAIPKCLLVMASGRNFYAANEPFARLWGAELLLFTISSLILIYRVVARHAPSISDRLALTFWLICFVFGLTRQNLSVIGLWHLMGLAALFLAWWLTLKKRRKHLSTGMRTYRT